MNFGYELKRKRVFGLSNDDDGHQSRGAPPRPGRNKAKVYWARTTKNIVMQYDEGDGGSDAA